jgi:hypothetical protein
MAAVLADEGRVGAALSTYDGRVSRGDQRAVKRRDLR